MSEQEQSIDHASVVRRVMTRNSRMKKKYGPAIDQIVEGMRPLLQYGLDRMRDQNTNARVLWQELREEVQDPGPLHESYQELVEAMRRFPPYTEGGIKLTIRSTLQRSWAMIARGAETSNQLRDLRYRQRPSIWRASQPEKD
jgi:hypothetical protein